MSDSKQAIKESAPLTQAELQRQLAAIGVDPKGILLVHLSLRSLGPLENGGDTFLDALMEYMKDGLLVIPTHTWADVRRQQPVYDVLCSIPCIGWIPELFRQRPDVVRSLHPTHSLAAHGRDAETFLAGQEAFDTPCHPQSAYGKLLDQGAQVLLVGVDFGRNTLIHCIEEIADVPNRLTPGHEALVSIDAEGRRHKVPSRRHDDADSDNFVKLQPVMEARGTLKKVKLGQADVLSFNAADLLRDTLDMLQKDIRLFDDNRPIPESFYAEDLKTASPVPAPALPALKVHSGKRRLVTEDGKPFFWLGDTAWELFHALSREEAGFYLDDRAKKGFNVIQAVALAELDGLRTPNFYGRLPLKLDENGEPTTEPDTEGPYSYWDHVDAILGMAASRGIYTALLPTWGDKWNLAWGKGPVIFNPETAYDYGKWIGRRYRDRNEIVWVLGGDRAVETAEQRDTVNALAKGIEEATNHRQLMTFHPSGNSSSLEQIGKPEWLDFHMLQSGHAERYFANYKMIEQTLAEDPDRPVVDGEPRYEDHPVGFKPENGLYDSADVRQAAYWGVLAGGIGITYGHHSIWSMTREPSEYTVLTWQQALGQPGSYHMTHLKNLMESRPAEQRMPDQGLLAANYKGANTQRAVRGERYAFIYAPQGMLISVQGGALQGEKLKSSWFNPRTGEISPHETRENQGVLRYNPPSKGRLEDWLLILDAVD